MVWIYQVCNFYIVAPILHKQKMTFKSHETWWTWHIWLLILFVLCLLYVFIFPHPHTFMRFRTRPYHMTCPRWAWWCVSPVKHPGGRKDILRSWWAKPASLWLSSYDDVLMICVYGGSDVQAVDCCRNDCVRMWVVSCQFVSQFPWCMVSLRSTLRHKSLKSYLNFGWIKKTSNDQSTWFEMFDHPIHPLTLVN